MSTDQDAHHLAGCAPVPLSHYLKALGILRIVAEQADVNAQGWWHGDAFYLRTRLADQRVVDFILNEYCPTPLVGPWGARSGFFSGSSEKTARTALERIQATSMERLSPFRSAIVAVRQVLKHLNLTDKADTSEAKRRLMMCCREQFPDELLAWLDATYVLLETETKYPPLLGTGGNEGSGSYMSGFAQQVVSVIVDRQWDHALRPSLFGETSADVAASQTPGHFSPAAAGGPNSSQGFDGGLTTNPWDYLLMLEGTLLFASASVKRLEQRGDGSLGFPFCVRPAGVGYPSAADADEGPARAEMWFPLWTRPAGLPELIALFSEGRATVNQRAARNGVDFARALASFGVDRGIDAFERYGFHQRNGLSYFSIPLGRFPATRKPRIDLLDSIDDWLESFRRRASSDNAPARARRALNQLESAVMELCRRGERRQVQAVLIALGQCEASMAVSRKWREAAFLRPVPPLDPQWLLDGCDGTAEFRLAAGLACIDDRQVGPFRRHVEPVIVGRSDTGGWAKWSDMPDDPRLVWGAGGLVRNLAAVLCRRVVDALRTGKEAGRERLAFPERAVWTVSLGDVAAFIAGDVNHVQIESLLRGLLLVDWSRVERDDIESLVRGPMEPVPDAAYGLLKLCHLPFLIRDVSVPLSPTITQRAAIAQIPAATQIAARRLLASGLVPAVDAVAHRGAVGQRIAAALMFPLNRDAARMLANRVLRPPTRAQSGVPEEEEEKADVLT